MCKVTAREHEDLEGLLRRFKNKVNEANILAEIKKREFYVSRNQRRREERKEAAAKRRKLARKLKQAKAQQSPLIY